MVEIEQKKQYLAKARSKLRYSANSTSTVALLGLAGNFNDTETDGLPLQIVFEGEYQ